MALHRVRRAARPAGEAMTRRLMAIADRMGIRRAVRLAESNLGGGPALIKKIMKDHHVPSLPELISSAQRTGVRLIACTMTMDLLGIAHDDLIDGVELGGAAMFFGEANESNGAFFI